METTNNISSSSSETADNVSSTSDIPTSRFPVTSQEADIVEDLLAKEMDKLSMNEHEKILFDVYGLVPFEDADPDTIEIKLTEMDKELTNVPNQEAYASAKKMNETYVSSRKFRLMFLRRENFNAKTAAELLVQHFRIKQDLFGDGEVLGRDVYQSDLSQEERDVLEEGCLQIVPTRDGGGRTVLLSSSNIKKVQSENWIIEGGCRVMWYVEMAALKDDETQKQGIVWVTLYDHEYKVTEEELKRIQEVESGIPYRIAGGHFCYTDLAMRPYATGFQYLAPDDERNRMRIHCGTREEIEFELQTFGIPTQDFHMKDDGSLDTTEHCKWLAMLRAQEEEKKTKSLNGQVDDAEYIIVPRRFDVLFGKHRQAREHTGTKRALHIVEMYYDAYDSLDKLERKSITDRIISIIHQSNGRFLRQDEKGAWVVADNEDAKKKLGHWFRHSRSKKSAAAKKLGEVQTVEDESDHPALKRVTPCASPVDEDEEIQPYPMQSKKPARQ